MKLTVSVFCISHKYMLCPLSALSVLSVLSVLMEGFSPLKLLFDDYLLIHNRYLV
jgi:hypothetical protein